MQSKRQKRSRYRAANHTAGHGSKKKNRGAGHRGGRGKSGSGKRGKAKLMKVTKGDINYLGKHGFSALKTRISTINLEELQARLNNMLSQSLISKNKDSYEIDLDKLKYEKLLSKGSVRVKLNIKVRLASPNAVSKVVAAGGKVMLLESPEKNQETEELK